jgi:hypothetical protein
MSKYSWQAISPDDDYAKWIERTTENHKKVNEKVITEEDYIGKETTIDFGGDLRMSQPWRSYKSDEVFIITKKTKAGLYMVKDTKGKEHPISKRSINYFRQK